VQSKLVQLLAGQSHLPWGFCRGCILPSGVLVLGFLPVWWIHCAGLTCCSSPHASNAGFESMWHLIWKGEQGQPEGEREKKVSTYFLLLIQKKTCVTSSGTSLIQVPEEREGAEERGATRTSVTNGYYNQHIQP